LAEDIDLLRTEWKPAGSPGSMIIARQMPSAAITISTTMTVKTQRNSFGRKLLNDSIFRFSSIYRNTIHNYRLSVNRFIEKQ